MQTRICSSVLVIQGADAVAYLHSEKILEKRYTSDVACLQSLAGKSFASFIELLALDEADDQGRNLTFEV